MPGNWGYLGNDVKEYLTKNYNSECTILDVGCGHGYYFKLLNDYFNKFDAVEIWEPYIKEFNLTKMYDNVFNVNILDFDFEYYDIIIMGDILEHLSRTDAARILNKLKDKCKELIVVVPYYLPQDEVFGNKYEIHLQPDLDDTIMEEHYSMLEMINIDGKVLKIPIEVGENKYYYCAFKKRQK